MTCFCCLVLVVCLFVLYFIQSTCQLSWNSVRTWLMGSWCFVLSRQHTLCLKVFTMHYLMIIFTKKLSLHHHKVIYRTYKHKIEKQIRYKSTNWANIILHIIALPLCKYCSMDLLFIFFFSSSSSDKTVKVWDAGSRQCVQTFYEHNDQVYK